MRVEARALHKHYGEVAALRDVSFSFEAGSRVALLGPNGSGKSTLNRAVLGLIRCRGELRVDGRDPFAERAELARRIAYVPQTAPQLAATVSELIRASCGLRGFSPAEVEKLAARLDLSLSEVAERPFRSLSGGMKQKLLGALALAARPALLVLDEPTGSLDAASRARLLALVAEQPAETTMLLCSHRLEEVRVLAREVLVLAEGHVVRRGPLGEFLDDSLVCVIDLCARGESAHRALAARGFERVAAERFSRLVSRREKARLVAELAGALGAALVDLEVRDVELGFVEHARGET